MGISQWRAYASPPRVADETQAEDPEYEDSSALPEHEAPSSGMEKLEEEADERRTHMYSGAEPATILFFFLLHDLLVMLH
jgi:hypothetical protein